MLVMSLLWSYYRGHVVLRGSFTDSKMVITRLLSHPNIYKEFYSPTSQWMNSYKCRRIRKAIFIFENKSYKIRGTTETNLPGLASNSQITLLVNLKMM